MSIVDGSLAKYYAKFVIRMIPVLRTFFRANYLPEFYFITQPESARVSYNFSRIVRKFSNLCC